jgi:hypothetical protein
MLSLALPATALAEDNAALNWSGRVRAYGNSSGAVGIYRTLSPRWDFGLQMSVDLGTSETDRVGTASYDYDSDRSDLTVSVYPEIRRRDEKSQTLSTYWGIQGRYSYQHAQQTSERSAPYSSFDQNDDWTTTLGVAATFGALVRVHRYIGISADLVPLALSYAWTSSEDSSRQDDEIAETRKEDGNRFDLDLTISPALYVVIFF